MKKFKKFFSIFGVIIVLAGVLVVPITANAYTNPEFIVPFVPTYREETWTFMWDDNINYDWPNFANGLDMGNYEAYRFNNAIDYREESEFIIGVANKPEQYAPSSWFGDGDIYIYGFKYRLYFDSEYSMMPIPSNSTLFAYKGSAWSWDYVYDELLQSNTGILCLSVSFGYYYNNEWNVDEQPLVYYGVDREELTSSECFLIMSYFNMSFGNGVYYPEGSVDVTFPTLQLDTDRYYYYHGTADEQSCFAMMDFMNSTSFELSAEYEYRESYDYGYNNGKKDGYNLGYHDGKHNADSDALGKNLLGDTLSVPFKALNNFILWQHDGINVTLGHIVGAIIALLVFFLFLRMFNGN